MSTTARLTAASRRDGDFEPTLPPLGFDEIKAPLDLFDISRHPVHQTGDVGIIRFEGAETFAHFDDICLDLTDINSYRPQMFQDEVVGAIRHGRNIART
jgi:hypothetical protein